MKTLHNPLLAFALLIACAACTKEEAMAPRIPAPDCSFPLANDEGTNASPDRGDDWSPTEPFLED